MKLRFAKMHGLGNDFMVVDMITQHHQLDSTQIRALSDRFTGVGFDQLLLVQIPQVPEADFRFRIFNANGQEVQHCGNGARCIAHFVHDQRLTGKRDIVVQTATDYITLHILANNQVTVDMNVPILEPTRIPFIAQSSSNSYAINVNGVTYKIGVISMGNPHCVLIVNDVEQAPVVRLGNQLQHHSRFPQQANIGFMQIIDRKSIKLRVFERGVGETLACGTGACAAVVNGILQGLLNNNVTVHLRGGNLKIQWRGVGQKLYMTGSTSHVYEGKIFL